jgi:hypothetical protein
LRYLRGRSDLDGGRLALWGDSFAPANSREENLAVPLDEQKLPRHAEPLGGLLALFGGLFENEVRAIYVHGGLTGYQSLLQGPYLYVPHDALIPSALAEGDICDVAAVLAPRPLRMEGLVDGLNRPVSADALASTFDRTRAAYRSLRAESRLQLLEGAPVDPSAARWILQQVQGN